MLYPHSKDEKLEKSLFENPGSEYRCAPFWAWNGRLEKDELLRQIDIFKEMGMGGFHMHSRSGMATPYLSDEFMDLTRACRDEAEKNHMLCWLYDEDRWPSGAAGGLVTRDRRYAARYLLFTPTPYGQGEKSTVTTSQSVGARQENGTLLAQYRVTLKDGCLAHYERVQNGAPHEDGMWYAYLEISAPSPWYNNETYLDTLNPKAVEKFVATTHERYKEALGESFGKTVPAIFTDEPQFSRKQTLGFAGEKKDVTLPFTNDLCETYQAAYGEDLLDKLPELIWELPEGRISVTRYHYHDHIAERFSSAFADTVGGWCGKNGIMLTGHMMEEPTLESQTAALGEAMRSYRSFQLPGIDMLCDHREFTTAKQAASAVHQFGYPGMTSELYGVTNWDFDFRGHKLQGDWQAALGVTVRVPHLSWYTMGGPAKRDYPASISYQSAWYKEYPYVENYFARVNTALTRGTCDIHVGVVHPVESYWLHWGPREQTAAVREEMDRAFQSMARWLVCGMIDYDYISESLLPRQCEKGGAPLSVGKMAYDAVVVPGCETLRSSTVERLEAFRAAGGRLIFAGRIPTLVDAVPSDRVKKLAGQSVCIGMNGVELLEALDDFRQVDVRGEKGSRTSGLIHQMRKDGDDRWLFICQAFNPKNKFVTSPERCEIRLRGSWTVEKWDALTGEVGTIEQRIEDGVTYVYNTFDAHDSLLLKLSPACPCCARPVPAPEKGAALTEVRAANPVAVKLSEPNVMVLDMARYSLDNEPWHEREEILRADDNVRRLLGWKLRSEHFAQPWVTAGVDFGDAKHTLAFAFDIVSRIPVSGAKLALEDSEYASITFDGKPVAVNVDGWYVDKCLDTVALPDFAAGTHELVVKYDYQRKVNPEWMYLIGDFGVYSCGSHSELTEKVTSLYYGDWRNQGLPFYGGALTYVIPCACDANGLTVETDQYEGALVSVRLDGEDKGRIVYAPYTLHIDAPAGEHTLELTVFGSRVNSFGALHNCNDALSWVGPSAWESRGKEFSYEYRTRPMGLLVAPRLFK
ncbi:MAG: hypothetical protein PUD68_09585 [Clostridiales bacterium]|nr:hypothetical protein [Clostridiales bacterium]MDD7366959.1 hypothetical protein [Clostridiales bacterium]MDY2871844.1 hypothetical protein [Eubacteriales bacterium]